MEVHQVLISLTLIQKIRNWGDQDQVIFSAFIQCLREFDAIIVLNGFNCSVESLDFASDDLVEEAVVWMELRGSYIRFILREVAAGNFVVSDR
ncbi:MAG TPA: hypothetical protein DFK13_12405 [Erythrobacter sp.]|nr:hypothetical protein [Erythrobacter sp.]|tara:strand:- start:4 stop:282 length:279 start_codon:yes stop_codon:yes gene_type:complete